MGDTREGRRRYALKRFGLTPAGYTVMLRRQSGRCAICQQPPTKRRLAVDHNHRSGQVRGLLCTRCNTLLGTVDDNVVRLRAAITYLQNGGWW